MSAYFWHSEAWSGRNQRLLERVIEVVRVAQLPWVLAADFNMSPEGFSRHCVTVGLKGTLVRPNRGTCFVQGAWSTIDYFIIDPVLAPAIERVWVEEGAHAAPHLPVRLRLRRQCGVQLTRSLKAPVQFPLEVQGCAPPPKAWEAIRGEAWSGQEATRAWSSWARSAEDELCAYHGLEGKEAARARGRGRGPKWAVGEVQAPRMRNEPRLSQEAKCWRWMARRLAELWALAYRHEVQQSREAPHGGLRHLQGVRKQLEEKVGRTHALPVECRARWKDILRRAARLKVRGAEQLEAIAKWNEEAKQEADRQEKKCYREQQAKFKQFIQRGSEGSAALLHRLAKPIQVWAPRLVEGGASVASPLEAAEHVGECWAKIWKMRGCEAFDGPRPWLEAQGDEPMPRALWGCRSPQGMQELQDRDGLGGGRFPPQVLGPAQR